MVESSSHNPYSLKITPKEEPDTLDKPKCPNPFLPADQIEFTFEEIAFTTNNEVTLLYPSHPNSKYFREVSTPTGGIRGDIVRPWFATIGYNEEIGAKVAGEMHKEAHQAAGGPTSLGATSEEGAHPQLGSGHDALTDSTTETDHGLSAPNDSIPSTGTNPSVLVDQTKSGGDGLKTAQND
ncbi:hypothetical protein Tco_0240559 [Tanacetum coccineum]